jgi:hypothetical protein
MVCMPQGEPRVAASGQRSESEGERMDRREPLGVAHCVSAGAEPMGLEKVTMGRFCSWGAVPRARGKGELAMRMRWKVPERVRLSQGGGGGVEAAGVAGVDGAGERARRAARSEGESRV